MNKKITIISFIIIVGIFFSNYFHHQKHFKVENGQIFGTTYQLIFQNHHQFNSNQFYHSLNLIFETFNQHLSNHHTDSEISQFNRSQDIKNSFKASQLLFDTVRKSLLIYDETMGHFDITVSPLVDIWGFGTKDQIEFPEQQMIDDVMTYTGSELLLIGQPDKIKKLNPQLQINVNAIAKGLCVDEISKLMDRYKIQNYCIEVGGEVRVKGLNPYGKKWRIGLEYPHEQNQPGEQVIDVIHISDISVATSGNYRQFHDKNGVRYTHIINPQTGYPVNHDLVSVTVLAQSCLSADAYATALFVMGKEKGMKWVDEHEHVEACFVYKDNDSFHSLSSNGFKQFLTE